MFEQLVPQLKQLDLSPQFTSMLCYSKHFPSNHKASLVVSSHLREALLCPDFSFWCGIHVEVNNLELYCVETDLLCRLKKSPNFPSALSPSLSLPPSSQSRWPTLIRQTVIPQCATFSFPLRLNWHAGGVTLTTDPVLLVCWLYDHVKRKGGRCGRIGSVVEQAHV